MTKRFSINDYHRCDLQSLRTLIRADYRRFWFSIEHASIELNGEINANGGAILISFDRCWQCIPNRNGCLHVSMFIWTRYIMLNRHGNMVIHFSLLGKEHRKQKQHLAIWLLSITVFDLTWLTFLYDSSWNELNIRILFFSFSDVMFE